MALFDTRADWDKYYSVHAEPWGRPNTRASAVRLHYNDWSIGQHQTLLGMHLKTLNNIGNNMKVAVIGAGFGWTVEGLNLAGAQAIGTDISSWILANKDVDEEGDLRDYISAAGLDPDNDEIIGPPNHPKATLYVPAAKQAAFDSFLLSDEYLRRKAFVEEWQTYTDEQKKVWRTEHTVQDDFEPKLLTAPKPEWMIKPLDLYKTRTGPRTSATIVDEDGSNNNSLRAIANQLGSSVDVVFTEELLNSVSDDQGLLICNYVSNLLSRHGNSGAKIIHMLTQKKEDSRQDPNLNWKTFAEWRTFLDANGFNSHVIMNNDHSAGFYTGGFY